MTLATEVLSWVSTIALVVISGVALREFFRQRDRSRAALASALTLVAFISLGGRLNQIFGPFRALSDLTTVGFAVSGYALLVYRGTIVALARWVRVAAAAATAAAAGFVLAVRIPLSPDATHSGVQRLSVLILVVVWSVFVLEPAFRFWVTAKLRSPVERARLRVLAAGYTGIVGVLVVAVVVGPGLRQVPASLALQVFILGLVVVLYTAVAPPLRLRRWWMRRAGQRQAMSSIGVGGWYWDAVSQVVAWTPAMHEVAGTDPDTFTPTYDSSVSVVHPEDRDLVEAVWSEHAQTRMPFSVDHRIVRPDGSVRWVQSRGWVVSDPASGEVTGIFGTVQDITARKEAEHALQQAYERERQAADSLRELAEMKNAVLEAVSHELRTPLTAVVGFASTLERGDIGVDPQDVRRMASRIVVNAERLERLLGDLLDLDRMARGVLQPNARPTRMTELVRGVLEDVHLNGHTLQVDIADVVAHVSPAQAERIIENLLANAVRHTPAGTPIWLHVRTHEDGVLIMVEDAGPGVDDRLKRGVFESFQRGEGRAARAGGTGVGLSLVARFAELHGGRAWVEDRPGGGASFRVFLPGTAADLEIGVPERAHRTA